jgi:DNA polymerase II small subunit/DNA polymerase delta subunit B
MERTLRWRHLAPTAPNTLGIYMLNLYLLGIHNLCHFLHSSENHGMVEQIVNVCCILPAASKEI